MTTVIIKTKTVSQALEKARVYGFTQAPVRSVQRGRRRALVYFLMSGKPTH